MFSGRANRLVLSRDWARVLVMLVKQLQQSAQVDAVGITKTEIRKCT